MALSVSLVQYEVSIGYAVDAHVHDRLVFHAHDSAPITPTSVTIMLTWLFALAAILSLPHAVRVVVLRLASGTLRT